MLSGGIMKLLNRLKINATVLFKYFISICGSLTAIASLILAFISWEDIGIKNFSCKTLILAGIVVASLIVAAITIFVRNEKAIFGDLDKGLSIQYGDVIDLGFDNHGKSKKIIVIPVNRCFDLSCENNLISEESIHGQWLKNYITSEKYREELHNKIEALLVESNANYIELTSSEKKHGYLKRYAPGSIVELTETNGITFYLLGVSELDGDLKAHSTEIDYFKALQSLVEYYDSHGQCVDLYCPVFGDHIIRPTRPTEDVLHFMISAFKINKLNIHGNIHIVVYDQKKADVPILKYCD